MEALLLTRRAKRGWITQYHTSLKTLLSDDCPLTSEELHAELDGAISNFRLELDELLTLQEEIEIQLQLRLVNTDDLRRDGARGGEGHVYDQLQSRHPHTLIEFPLIISKTTLE